MMCQQLDIKEDKRQQSWWPEVIKDVEKYIDRYDIYQRMKSHTEVLVGKLMVNEASEKP